MGSLLSGITKVPLFSGAISKMSDEESDQEGPKGGRDKLDIILEQLADLKRYSKKKFDECNQNISKVMNNQNVLQKEITVLNEKCIKQAAELQELNNIIKNRDRQAVAYTLNISSIPEEKNEDLMKIVVSLGKKLNIQIDNSNIAKVYRRENKAKGSLGNIVVTCVTLATKDSLLGAIKKSKIHIKDIGFKGENKQIYANQELIPSDNDLLRAALRLRKDQNIKFTWVSRGAILIRKNEGDPAIKITSQKHLLKLVQ